MNIAQSFLAIFYDRLCYPVFVFFGAFAIAIWLCSIFNVFDN